MDHRVLVDSALRYIRDHPGRVLGTILGLLVGVSLLWLGFWRTLVLGFCAIVGYAIGNWSDHEGKGFREFLEEKLPGGPYYR